MPCVHNINSVDDGFQLFGWILFSLITTGWGLYFCWNPVWWSILRGNTGYVPSDPVMQAIISVFSLAGGWGAWRLWFCNSWDIKYVPLMLYVFEIIFMTLYFPAVMLSPSAWLPLGVSVVAIGFSAAYTGFAFVTDTWAGVVGVVALLLNLYLFFIALYLVIHQLSHEKDAYRFYADHNDSIMPSGGRGLTSMVSSMTNPPPPAPANTGTAPIGIRIRRPQ